MPAEWERHEATWLAWPHNQETWPGERLTRVEEIYLQMLEALLPGEKVHLLVNDGREEEKVFKLLQKRSVSSKNLLTHRMPTVDAWIRDWGPTFVKRKSTVNSQQSTEKKDFKSADRGPWTADSDLAYIKWTFNAWGNKYPTLAEDNKVFKPKRYPRRFASQSEAAGVPFEAGIVLEGGSIEVNGTGTCLTTEQCLLNSNRNPELSREKIERVLKDYLGVKQILWLGEGIVGDDTDGHIDDIARFVNPTTLLAAFEDDSSDDNYPMLKKNWERLERATDSKGKKWNLVRLPMPPGPVVDLGVRLPASYANFYIANGVVLVPTYDLRSDERALAILKELFPNRHIMGMGCRDLSYGLGAIHCVTQQEPW